MPNSLLRTTTRVFEENDIETNKISNQRKASNVKLDQVTHLHKESTGSDLSTVTYTKVQRIQ